MRGIDGISCSALCQWPARHPERPLKKQCYEIIANMRLVMPSTLCPGAVITGAVTTRPMVVRRFKRRNDRGVPKIGGQHQYEGRHDAEREKRVQRR